MGNVTSLGNVPNFGNVNSCSSNLESQVCFNYCLNNPNECEQILGNYCFNEVVDDPLSARIFTSESCNLLTKNIMSTRQNSTLHNKISNFCVGWLSVNGENFENYTNGSNLELDNKIRDLCSCHLSPEVYTNYYNSLIEKYPSIQNKNIHPKCLFPSCGYGTSYKTQDIKLSNFQTICPSVNCVNLIKITGNGTIDNLNILSNGECFNYVSEIRNCRSASDCQENQKCINNVCVQPTDIGISCFKDDDCEEGNKCYKNLCRPISYCESNVDCGIETKCYKNICSPLDICEKDNDCFLNYKCNNGKCINPEENKNRIIIPTGIGIIVFIIIIIFIFSIYVLKSK